eukprot:TRINITY_DN8193_c0_g1_i1.p1 TRINITY_DN8193_c0_g1~~TRINITY_DN8193_c0_g1_i1.p1  ORF type:complete len:157 (+),score=11.93 TRINITY_DN8193_c0_g1_i1:64-534(+)
MEPAIQISTRLVPNEADETMLTVSCPEVLIKDQIFSHQLSDDLVLPKANPRSILRNRSASTLRVETDKVQISRPKTQRLDRFGNSIDGEMKKQHISFKGSPQIHEVESLGTLPKRPRMRKHRSECSCNLFLSLIHISEPTRQAEISYAVFCLKKKK